ncbi:hypothetical protein FOZ60_003450 [Perkinsus olseni]|uniref:Uncharacterized protein n=1 Tax=Perkinsus olseni TaxID=32597 RepID=A0A7J6NVE4_PEROL|nr:hypothetical protein FOZ60_003450 [Perkinsus olseni]
MGRGIILLGFGSSLRTAMPFHPSCVVFLSVIVGTVASESRAAYRRRSALHDLGIYPGEEMSGCRIRQKAPLEPMEFVVKMNWKDEKSRPEPPGEVWFTSLKDLNNKREYKFEKILTRFDGKVGDVSLFFGDESDWTEMRDAGLLPLEHLSSKTLEILKKNAAEGSWYYIGTEPCVRIVDAIINDPPPGYEKYKGSSEWILKFHRVRADEMIRKLKERIQIQAEREKK